MPRSRGGANSPMDAMPGIAMPEHPYERIYPRRIWGLSLIIAITIICSIIVIYIIYQSESGAIELRDRSTALLLVLLAWVICTGLVSKWAFGRFTVGFGGSTVRENTEEEK